MKYIFKADGDGHWFLIPENLASRFEMMLGEGEDDYYTAFCHFFEEYSSDDPQSFTFTKTEDGGLNIE